MTESSVPDHEVTTPSEHTDQVCASFDGDTRLAEVMTAAVRHLHALPKRCS